MIDRAIFESEITRIAPQSSPIDVGSFSGFFHEMQTPAHGFSYVDLYVPDFGFLHIIARDSFRKELLNQLVKVFERVRLKKYKMDMLYVSDAYELEGFDSAGLAPPPLAKTYNTQSDILQKSGFHLFPMHGIEFLHGFSCNQFWTQRKRRDKWKVSILDWNRKIEFKSNKTVDPTR